ncbi:MAG: TetR/AcrR family transcriptional regulator [Clostridiales bacterium]|nr:TetR/AcrR family transcriptional regulator [Clostridiales bacterium]
MKNKENPTAIRSKKMLLAALLNLMKTSYFNDITIQEITDDAMLSRRTFYRNFKKKKRYSNTISINWGISILKD